ncbi:Endolytic peptidoglycan transglycosylase RlpA [Stutzerimonas stutzeri]
MDLSFAAAKKLGYAETGTARVKVEGIDPQQWWAAQGKPVPLVMAQAQAAAPKPASTLAQPHRAIHAAAATARRRGAAGRAGALA